MRINKILLAITLLLFVSCDSRIKLEITNMTSNDMALSGSYTDGTLFKSEARANEPRTFINSHFEEIVFHRDDDSVFLTLTRDELYGDEKNITINVQADYQYEIIKR